MHHAARVPLCKRRVRGLAESARFGSHDGQDGQDLFDPYDLDHEEPKVPDNVRPANKTIRKRQSVASARRQKTSGSKEVSVSAALKASRLADEGALDLEVEPLDDLNTNAQRAALERIHARFKETISIDDDGDFEEPPPAARPATRRENRGVLGPTIDFENLAKEAKQLRRSDSVLSAARDGVNDDPKLQAFLNKAWTDGDHSTGRDSYEADLKAALHASLLDPQQERKSSSSAANSSATKAPQRAMTVVNVEDEEEEEEEKEEEKGHQQSSLQRLKAPAVSSGNHEDFAFTCLYYGEAESDAVRPLTDVGGNMKVKRTDRTLLFRFERKFCLSFDEIHYVQVSSDSNEECVVIRLHKRAGTDVLQSYSKGFTDPDHPGVFVLVPAGSKSEARTLANKLAATLNDCSIRVVNTFQMRDRRVLNLCKSYTQKLRRNATSQNEPVTGASDSPIASAPRHKLLGKRQGEPSGSGDGPRLGKSRKIPADKFYSGSHTLKSSAPESHGQRMQILVMEKTNRNQDQSEARSKRRKSREKQSSPDASQLRMDNFVGSSSRRSARIANKGTDTIVLPEGDPSSVYLTYPFHGTNRIDITYGDLARLAKEDGYLNDSLVDYYVRRLFDRLAERNEAQRQRFHIFNSFFYKKYAKAKDHKRVAKWTKGVDIFKFDYIVIPIVEHMHWKMVIVCFPSTLSKVELRRLEEQTAIASDLSPKKSNGEVQTPQRTTSIIGRVIDFGRNLWGSPDSRQAAMEVDEDAKRDRVDSDEDKRNMANPVSGAAASSSTSALRKPTENIEPKLLVFDSLSDGAGGGANASIIRKYLTEEWAEKHSDEMKDFEPRNMPTVNLKLPQQLNGHDCGLFLLRYLQKVCMLLFKPHHIFSVLQFIESPWEDMRQTKLSSYKSWFPENEPTRLRKEIFDDVTAQYEEFETQKASLETYQAEHAARAGDAGDVQGAAGAAGAAAGAADAEESDDDLRIISEKVDDPPPPQVTLDCPSCHKTVTVSQKAEEVFECPECLDRLQIPAEPAAEKTKDADPDWTQTEDKPKRKSKRVKRPAVRRTGRSASSSEAVQSPDEKSSAKPVTEVDCMADGTDEEVPVEILNSDSKRAAKRPRAESERGMDRDVDVDMDIPDGDADDQKQTGKQRKIDAAPPGKRSTKQFLNLEHVVTVPTSPSSHTESASPVGSHVLAPAGPGRADGDDGVDLESIGV